MVEFAENTLATEGVLFSEEDDGDGEGLEVAERVWLDKTRLTCRGWEELSSEDSCLHRIKRNPRFNAKKNKVASLH